MIHLSLNKGSRGRLTVLCLGAHSDDIEIGCGGTILWLADKYPGAMFHWIVFSALGPRRHEALKAAELFTAGCYKKKVVVKNYRDGFLPFSGSKLKDFFERMKDQLNPDLIFTPWRRDAHQDHRLLAELSWNTFRDHLILEYEIPKYDGDLGQPNVFVPLDLEVSQKKVRYLMEVFLSQHTKRWFQQETFLSLMRLRGMECNGPSRYAEAFYCHKLVL
jgi:LmbE family N-acetylglucosaminyl deacetylase